MSMSRTLEVGAAILLSVAALATSWSGYQATLWNGIQARKAADASAQRSCASRAFARGGQLRTRDLTMFLQWISAYSGNNEALKRFHERRFRPEFRGAFDAWVASAPARNPEAAASPFDMPQYRVAEDAVVARCDDQAIQASVDSQAANDASDRYMLGTVVFAVVMFFASAVRDAHSADIRRVMFALAFIACVIGVVFVARLPAATE